MNTERTLLAGLVGGLLHLVLVGGLHVYLYGPELFGYSATTNSFARFGPITVYVVVGAFLLGALPAVLLAERRLVTPTLTVSPTKSVSFVRIVYSRLAACPGGPYPSYRTRVPRRATRRRSLPRVTR